MESVANELEPYLPALSDRLGARPGGQSSFLSQSAPFAGHDEANWDAMADWLNEQTTTYQQAFAEILGSAE